MEILTAACSVLVVAAAYWLPGAAVSLLIDWRGMGKGTRIFLPVPISLVTVPAALNLVSVVWPQPPLWPVTAALTAVAFLAALILIRLDRRPVLEFRRRNGEKPARWETFAAFGVVTLISAMAMLPRLQMLIGSDQIATTVISDIYWHLSELTSLVRSGLPPQHFLFPDTPLVYYYWSWIYPALLSELPLGHSSLLQLLNVHALGNLLTYLAMVCVLLRANLGSWKSRAFALMFLTLVGGFDFFIAPSMYPHEWWQTGISSLMSHVQIPAPLTTYMWVPQHIAGSLSILCMLILWRNVRGSLMVRGVLAAVLAAFLFGTSVFEFLAFVIGAALWAFFYRRLWMRRRALPRIAAVAGLFILLAGNQMLLALRGGGVLRWGGFRLVIVEALTGTTYARAAIIDQVLTLIAFPLVVGFILLIEMGIPAALYAAFAFRHSSRHSTPWHRFLSLFPVLYVPFAFLLRPPNIGMRGMIPVMLIMVVAAATYFETAFFRRWVGWRRFAWMYIAGILLAAQCFSPLPEWWFYSRRALTQILQPSAPVFALPGEGAYPDDNQALLAQFFGKPIELAYIDWVNQNLPADALVLEVGILHGDNRHHLLERMRMVSPAEVAEGEDGQRDFTLAGSADLFAWWGSLPGVEPWEKVMQTEYVRTRKPPVYLILPVNSAAVAGPLVYRDQYVSIFLLASGG